MSSNERRIKICTMTEFNGIHPRYFLEGTQVFRQMEDGSMREMPQQLHTKDYLTVSLRNNNKQRNVRVHVLVCTAHRGDRPSPNHTVDHINGIKWDNRPENLQWLPRDLNVARSFAPLHENVVVFHRMMQAAGSRMTATDIARLTPHYQEKIKRALDGKTRKNHQPAEAIPRNWRNIVVDETSGHRVISCERGNRTKAELVKLKRLATRARDKRLLRNAGITGGERTRAFKDELAATCKGKHPIFTDEAWNVFEQHFLKFANEVKKVA